MTKLTIEFTPRHFNLPRAPVPGVDPWAIPIGNVDERGESGLMEFHGLTPDFADTLPAER
jgi:hypothetical protein